MEEGDEKSKLVHNDNDAKEDNARQRVCLCMCVHSQSDLCFFLFLTQLNHLALGREELFNLS